MGEHNNDYNHIYGSEKAIRRYPEADVISFAASLSNPKVLADLGTGTGRNLLPLLCVADRDSIVVASDIAISGLNIICKWAESLGAFRLKTTDLSKKELGALKHTGLKTQGNAIYRIERHKDVANLGPCALHHLNPVFNSTRGQNANTVLLVVGKGDMTSPGFNHNSIDAIVNRGSIFYLPTNQISRSVKAMYAVLHQGGRLLLTLKSIEDSRFKNLKPVNGSKWRRIQVDGPQAGLEMDFFSEERVLRLVSDFIIIKIEHLLSENYSTKVITADWSLVLEK